MWEYVEWEECEIFLFTMEHVAHINQLCYM